MPKKSPKAKNFYESLAHAGEQFLAPGGQAEHFIQEQAKKLQPAIKSFSELATAASADAWRRVRITTKRALSKNARRTYLATALAGTTVAVAVAAMVGSSTLALYGKDLTSPAALLSKKKTGTTILDRNGEVLFRTYGANNRKEVGISQVPENLVDATLAAEDPHFFNHAGFSWKDTGRAIFTNIVNNQKVQGGSTITQQLVKNALLTPEKSYKRKYQEILLAMQVERRYSKQQIMEMYLNAVYYGQGAYGVESASQTYFKKPVTQLSLSESALIAGLTLGPSRFDPNVDPVAAKGRRDFIIERMKDLKYITAEEARSAKAEPIQASAHQVTVRAPHFVFYVLDLLREQYGNELVEHGGITVYTSLDLAKQQKAEEIVRAQIERLRGNQVSNAGLVSVDPSNGDIIAMVGSTDYNAPGFGNVNVTLSQLQPGSSFKPIVYATAFKKGWNGASVVVDKPMTVRNPDGSIYKPENYDGTFRGPVTLRRALANSLNIPALEVIKFAGISETLQTAHEMGISSLNQPERYGISLALGAGEASPLDMSTAFTVFANNGKRMDPNPIIKVLDRQDRVLAEKPTPKPNEVLDPRIAYMITNILSDNQARAEEFGPRSPLVLSRPAAAKTGTTNDFRDNWTVGFTPDLVTAVWVGNNDHSPMRNVSGITGAAPIWNQFMEFAHQGLPVKDFLRPDGLVEASVCMKDGGLANPWDRAVKELFLKESVPTRKCSSEEPKPEPQPQEEAKPEEKEPKEPSPQGNNDEKNNRD